MSTRVLSTEEGKAAISQMHTIINEGLSEQIGFLNDQGVILCDPMVWDGNLADQFRADWPEYHHKLTEANAALEELRGIIENINLNIMLAGGNA